MNSPKLDYLFTAVFTDGSIVEQNPEDKGTSPNARNCYSDVLFAQKEGKQLHFFHLKGKGNTLTVDLVGGMFYVNGLEVLLESEKLPGMPEKFDLVWYHQVTQDIEVDTKVNDKLGVDITAMRPHEGLREYFIGWECNINGKVYKQKIAVA